VKLATEWRQELELAERPNGVNLNVLRLRTCVISLSNVLRVEPVSALHAGRAIAGSISESRVNRP
jgi:hypothetical protein